MTEETGDIQNQDLGAATEELAPAVPQEDMIPKSHVQKIVQTRIEGVRDKAEKEGYERALREHQAKFQSSTMGGMPMHNSEDIRRMILEEAKKEADTQVANHILNQMSNKIESAKTSNPEIENAIHELGLFTEENAYLIPFLNGLDNTTDVISDLHQNPAKYANVLALASRAPHLVPRELHKLSQSIKRNQEAANVKPPNEPLSQLNPSTTSTDSGVYDANYWRKHPRSRR